MNPSLLHLMHLVSPALPVGAYAYSQGMEYAVELGYLPDKASAQQWIEGVMQHSISHLDLPVLARLYDSWQQQDLEQVNHWNQFLLASRESAEFELEDTQMGRALMRLLVSLELLAAADWPRQQPSSFANGFAMAGVYWSVDKASLLHGFCWSWLENQVAAATKLVPLGQTQAQQLLVDLMPAVEHCCQQALSLSDDNLGAGLPALALISAQHETQYSRLFRS
ncbi:urease accessory protein UreF [Oceanicoccus sp.]|uniref:urease accessory protein UreF n=1 Tax=Oceanicoccus sp. TaxID=2691044 RepID=UPI00345DC4A2